MTSEVEKEIQKSLEALKDIELIRGETLDGINEKCLHLCNVFIDGPWSYANDAEKDIEVKRITGGMTNQLYHVALKDHVLERAKQSGGNLSVAKEVTIKFHQAKYMKPYFYEDERMPDAIVSAILSEIKLGPKTYGISKEAIVQEYYPNEQFRKKHQKNPKLLRELAHNLARINLLNIPIPKGNNWMKDLMEKSINLAYEINENLDKDIEQKLSVWTETTLRKEFDLYKKAYDNFKAPIVFCHNDFRGSNILVTEPDEKIVVVDYEYCAYGSRGYDLGSFMNEWDQDLFEFRPLEVLTDEVLTNFVQMYVEGCELVQPGFSTKPENSVEQIIKETKFGILSTYIFFLTFLLAQDVSKEKFMTENQSVFNTFIVASAERYLKLKNRFLNEGIISFD